MGLVRSRLNRKLGFRLRTAGAPTGMVVPVEKKIEAKKEVVKPTAMVVNYTDFLKGA